jgi:hypothetical protein
MEETLNYIKGNFQVLPIDMMRYIVHQLPFEDVIHLCNTNKDFQIYCKKYKLIDIPMIKYLEMNAPLFDRTSNLEQQTKLVKRGATTIYKYNIRTDKVDFGGIADLQWDELFFEIRGGPAQKGREVYLFGFDLIDMNDEDDLQIYHHNAQIFLKKDDFSESYLDKTRPLSTEEDSFYADGKFFGILEKAINHLKLTGSVKWRDFIPTQEGAYIFRKIVLP